MAVPAFICYIVLYPISKFASSSSNLILRIFGIKVNKEASDKAFTKVDLDYFIQSSIQDTDNGKEIDTEIKIFQNALDFSNIKIRDCMVPRTEIVSIEYGTSLEELKARFIESGISKIIVYKENIDNIVGYIHSSEMFREVTDWAEHIRQLPIVPETMGAHKLMKLEEIFGEIEDEHDTTSYIAKEIGDNEYILSGRLEIEKANELFSLDLPESDEYQTVGGLILHHYQSFPKMHEVIKFKLRLLKLSL